MVECLAMTPKNIVRAFTRLQIVTFDVVLLPCWMLQALD